MKKTLLSFVLLLGSMALYSQIEKYPVFKACDSTVISGLSSCFKNEVKKAIIDEIKLPENVKNENFTGSINVIFVVTSEGKFKTIYVNSPFKELKEEVERVFTVLPTITPAKYNNHPIEMQFVLPLKIPLENNFQDDIEALNTGDNEDLMKDGKDISKASTLFPEHKSRLNIPFTHEAYDSYEFYLNQTGNSHTSMKPYLYSEVSKHIDLDAEKNKLMKKKSTWFGRKVFNEHMAYIKGDDYWFTINPMVDLQVGRDSEGINTFNNTRAVQVNGGLGKNFNFSASFYESQGWFPGYVKQYADYIGPGDNNPAIIPGRGIVKEVIRDSYDYPVAEGYLSYTPNKFFNFQFGHGKNFIGDGYRSILFSDVASPYPFFKINTNFWKIKYTNLWMWMQDVRIELSEDGAYRQKFMALHHLSWNVTEKFNLGLFEAVIWDDANDRGFDINYLNPLIFYTAVEFSRGSRAGNALLGLNMKYKLKSASLYSQLVFDEFRVSEMTKNNGWWANKFGIQLGAKYINAFNVKNLYLQGEYNAIRPYTYSHKELNYNLGHNNQPLAHLWGANLREFVGIARYSKDRWFANAKFVIGKKGFDFKDDPENISYGGNIYQDTDNRISDYGNEIGQGNKADIFIGDLQVGYLMNPTTNLKLFAGLTFRDFNPDAPTNVFDKSNSTWFSIGLKTDVFNWYFDF